MALACSTTDSATADDASSQMDEGNDDADDDADADAGMDESDSANATAGDGDDVGLPTGDDDSAGSEETGTISFITEPDGGGPTNECDQWVQDCPMGEKCMPWANDGGSSWNATRCTEVADNPGQTGDECTVEGSGVSGIDTCEGGNMCYYVDPETNIGECVSLCFGSPEAPLCDPGFACSISNGGVLTLCRAQCDPLLQDCNNAACLPAAGADAFVCIVDASGEAGAAGDACEFLNACDPGNACLDASAVPDCGASGCCSQFCDLTDPDPDAFCDLTGQLCEAWFEEGEAPPDLEHVGVCAIPV